MKKLFFTKMHGIGNDFIIINDTELEKADIELTSKLIINMCNRNFGIGSDGIVIVARGKNKLFKYIMYNPDGTKAEMCGNGIRCYMKYLVDKGLTQNTNIDVETGIGKLNLDINKNIVTVDMGRPSKINDLVYETETLGDKFPLKIENMEFVFTPISMGNPHAVIFYKDINSGIAPLDKLNIQLYGPIIEKKTDIFPSKTNVEFAKIISEREVNMRVWERGAAETLACGTGACATVVVGILAGRLIEDEFIKVNLKGGSLEIKWSGNEKDSVIMKGEAEEVFEGYYYLNK